MKALTFSEFGGPGVFGVVEVPTPKPERDEVLIKVAAAGICYHDVLSRAGKLPRDQTGVILGHEISGEIVEVGSGIDASRVGERVVVYQRRYCGRCKYCLGGRHDLCRNSRIIGEDGGGGGYAEYTAVPSTHAVRIPDALDIVPAALASCPVGTSVRATLGLAQAGPGDVVLVTGASGGLGLHQIQVAKSVGAYVIAVSSTETKVPAIEAVGADEIVVSPKLDFSREVWKRTSKQGADIILENVGTRTLPESMKAAAQGAAIVVLGNIDATGVDISVGLTIGRRLRLMGSGNATYVDLDCALSLMAQQRVKPVIDTVLPFPEVARGHALMEQRGVTGRIVLNGW